MGNEPNIIYRPATHADIPAMAQIRAAEWGTEDYWVARIIAYMNVASAPQKALVARIVLVCEDAGIVVGFIAGHLTQRFDCDGELEWINVVKEKRGAGIAAALVHVLARWFVDNNARRVCIDPDEPARQFYAQLGAVALNKHWMVWEDISTLAQ